MEEAYVRHRNVIGLAANGERDDVTPRYDGTEIPEAYKLERRSSEVDNGTPLGGSGGKIEMAKVSGGDTGKGRIVVVRRRVENGGVDVVERRVRGTEELDRRER